MGSKEVVQIRHKQCVFINFLGGKYQYSINDKILDQWRGLIRAGVPSILCIVDFDEIHIIDRLDSDQKVNKVQTMEKRNVFTILKMILKTKFILNKFNKDDTIFIVRHPSLSELPLVIGLSKRKIVIELNGIYTDEFDKKSQINSIKSIVYNIFSKIAFTRVTGIVSVTKEIDRLVNAEEVDPSKRVVISNGVNSGPIQIRQPVTESHPIRLLAVANINTWHGYDRILKSVSLSEYKSNVEIIFVGEGPAKSSLVKLVDDLGLKNVQFLAQKKGVELDKFYNECDLALGVLALERKNLKEMCPLKHREYCSRGIPFIMSGEDPDFPLDCPFVLHLPSGEEINFEKIIEFAINMRNWVDHPSVMRAFALNNLDWSVKMKTYSEFLLKI